MISLQKSFLPRHLRLRAVQVRSEGHEEKKEFLKVFFALFALFAVKLLFLLEILFSELFLF